MDDFTKDVAGAYGLWKIREIEARLTEANKAASQRDEQYREESKERQREQSDREYEYQRDQERRGEEASARQQEQDKQHAEAQRRQEERHASTIERLTSEMSELKILLSLPESERASFLQRKEESRMLKRIQDEKQQKIVERKEQQRRLFQHEQREKLRSILIRFLSEGTFMGKNTPEGREAIELKIENCAYLFDDTIEKPDDSTLEITGIWRAGRKKRVPLAEILNMSPHDVTEMIAENNRFVDKMQADRNREQVKKQQLAATKQAKAEKAAELRGMRHFILVPFSILSIALLLKGAWAISIGILITVFILYCIPIGEEEF